MPSPLESRGSGKPLPKKVVKPSAELPDLYELQRSAERALKEIVSIISSGNSSESFKQSASYALHRLAYLSVDSLAHMASARLDLFKPMAQTCPVWPAFISRHNDYAKANKLMMEALDLGARHTLKFTFDEKVCGKRWSLKTPANLYAVEMIKELYMRRCACLSVDRSRKDKAMSEVRKRNGFKEPKITVQSNKLTRKILKLKPLCVETAEQWFDAGWLMLMESTDGKPESKARWRALGIHRSNHTETAKAGSKTEASNIQDGIKSKLRKAFFTVIASKPNEE